MKKDKFKKSYWIGIIIYAILTVIGFTATIFRVVNNRGTIDGVIVMQMVSLLMIVYYTFAGYKKPHGNQLKYIIWSFAMQCVFGAIHTWNEYDTLTKLLRVLPALMAVYMSGRLDRLNENKTITTIILALKAYTCFKSISVSAAAYGKPLGIMWILSVFTGVIIWMDICSAYFLRYHMHREAGFSEKKR